MDHERIRSCPFGDGANDRSLIKDVNTADADLARAGTLVPNGQEIVRRATRGKIDGQHPGIEIEGVQIRYGRVAVNDRRWIGCLVIQRTAWQAHDGSIIYRDDANRFNSHI